MLVTRQNRIPNIWVLMTMMPWALFFFQNTVAIVSFFILNRLIENPAALTFLQTLPGLIFLFFPLGSIISYQSDRIWTRWGRRKPFIIVGFTGLALVLSLYPLAPTAMFFVGLTFFSALMGCFLAPLEALKLETIPPAMRGRSAALMSWFVTLLNIVFWSTFIGRIDEVMMILGVHLSGDKILYWSAALLLLIAGFIYIFGLKEADPQSSLTGEKFHIRTLIKAVTMKELRYLYLLLFATSMLNAGLGNLGMLLYTDQWNYSNQEMGFNIAVGGVINLFLIPVVGLFADRGNRMRIYLWCMVAILVLKCVNFGYVTWYLPDQRPSLVEVIFFGEAICVFGIVAGVVYYPLVYDYIPRNLMGTYFAGAAILGGIISFVTLNGAGLFLLWWANLFQPPAGEMVRICVNQETSRAHIEETLRRAELKTPDGLPAQANDIVARAWYADGIVSDTGTCFEIRLRDSVGSDLLTRNTEIKGEIGTLDGQIALARYQGATGDKQTAREQELKAKKDVSAKLEADMAARSENWRGEVLRGLGNEVFSAGSEILQSADGQAVTAILALNRKPKDSELERLNRRLRQADPACIGVRTQRRERDFALICATTLADGEQPETATKTFVERIVALSASETPGLLTPGTIPTEMTVRPLARLDIRLVEVPVSDFLSPISRVVNAVLSQFTDIPAPDQKLHALARSLALDDSAGVDVARVDPLPERRKGVHVVAVATAANVADPEAWQKSINAALIKQAPNVKLTVPVPVVAKDVVPIKYDYFVGYLWMITLTCIGLSLILYFIRQEKRGKIHKLGAQEAQAEKQAQDQKSADMAAIQTTSELRSSTQPSETYTPGYLLPKLLLALTGLAVAGLAIRELTPDLRLIATGTRSEAVATAVVATKSGAPDERFVSQAELKAKLDQVSNSKDYTWVFWNEFTFDTADGATMTFRRDVGCKLKPSMPLVDDGGLPTAALLLYDAKHPEQTCLPLEYSTWFAPLLLALVGLVASAVGAILAWYARQPIVLSNTEALNPENDVSSSASAKVH